ncbi:HRDC domain-containing protein [Paenibacillus aestuarii]|uniref:HRDC domain-containing protein n=1 Tax=Paenibacillus aestuarii TaxID=516965 RepID=A0ABW0K8C7_9BACL|nr:HRDC domain-containing protein [Paenibacillus aestuarii]
MNIVFVNTLEKETGEHRVATAQVSIGEEHGIWHVYWCDQGDAGHPTQDEWYQGISWDEMLSAFRYGLRDKMRAGYRPLITADTDSGQRLSGKARMTQLLNYYSEENLNEPVYESLRQWRRELAAREGKPPYLFATNRVLRMISVFLPQNQDELRQIPGFGELKSTLHGKEILQFTVGQERKGSFPLDWVARTVDNAKFEAWQVAQKEHKLRMELDREAGKSKLLGIVAGGGDLTELQQVLSMPRRELLQWIEELGREGYDMDPLIDAELRTVPEEQQIKAWNAFKSEGERYLKPVLQHMNGGEEMKGKELDRAYEWLRLLRLRFRRDKDMFNAQAAS